ncbi:TonB-dependent receptor [Thauera linaloolentis 47Lol = DSM 12138]|uniref:TonB-dependent receptor n=2 Tax=Thauera linaloolentis TaxID=76112 RepID=N6Y824_THAL4|nr:TonB-dependent receptor [Thauera linaloolentis 47Lol = DSM 12138]
MTSLALSVAAAIGALPQTAWAQEAPVSISISPQPLGQALLQLGKQAGLQLFFSQETVAGYEAPAVSGSLSPDEALRRLLSGTGVSFRRTGTNVTLSRTAATADPATQLTQITVTGERTKDEVGHDKVYLENVISVYQDREQLQRFQTTNPGDVFKGMNGVYSMDTRSSQAITPNIRGISGEGRTPLTIDGTEQSTNVWLHQFGAGNRSYVDPALFRSVEVEKGPSLSRGVKSGVGGAVSIRTIEPEDLIPEGENWGIEVNLKAASNTKKPRNDPGSFYGKDYKDIPGAVRTNVNEVYFSDQDPRNKGNGELLNFDDHSGMIAIAGRNEYTDFLASYSRREQGNYYSGKSNASRYSGHDPYDKSSTDIHFPNLTKLYHGGDEVFNTDSEIETTLLKNNWYLPNQQKIGFQFMRTDMAFGETTPGNTLLNWALREGFEQANPDYDWSQYPRMVSERPRSEMKIDSYKLSYDLKPEDSRWLNLETSLWHTKTTGLRYQTGAHPYGLAILEGTQEYRNLETYDTLKRDMAWIFDDPVMGPMFEPLGVHDGTIVGAGRQWTKHDRTGFEFSNLMRLTDKLQMTFGGSWQKEKLDDKVEASVKEMPMFGGLAGVHKTTDLLGPRTGERKEWSAMMNLAWQPTGWLTLTAGTRYMRYKGKDTGLAKLRRQKNAFNAANQRIAGLELQYQTLMTSEVKAEYDRLRQEVIATSNAIDWSAPGIFTSVDTYSYTTGGGWVPSTNRYVPTDPQLRASAQRFLDFLSEHNSNPFLRIANIHFSGAQAQEVALASVISGGVLAFPSGGCLNSQPRPDCAAYASNTHLVSNVLVPSKDGKFDSSQNPFANGELDATEMVDDPNNPGTLVAKYKHNVFGEVAYERLDAGKAWEIPEDQSGEAFSPVLSATARITPFGTAFVRYAQTTRFPSLHELTSTSSWAGTEANFAINGASKPERNTNWELGYAHDLRQFFPEMHLADVRFSYFNTEIKDFIDRTWDLETIQFDRKKTRGLELQSRFDSGRYFGSLGATWRLKQETCDKDYASAMDPYYNRIPTCMTGGFNGTYSGNSLQPKYSIDLLLGARLLSNKLELGWRSVYHAGAENKELDKLLASQAGAGFTTWLPKDVWYRSQGMSSFYWKSVLLHDLYANFNLNKQMSLNLSVTNLTDEYYLDPMSKVLLPAPGRTLSAGLTINF